eukprot:403359539
MLQEYYRIKYEIDSKIRNFATITIEEEDHTLGNTVRVQLLKDTRVRFSGYRMPHPLEHKVEIKVQTNGEINPAEAVQNACLNTHAHVEQIKTSFQMAVNAFKIDQMHITRQAPSSGSMHGKNMGSSDYSYPTTNYTHM